MIHQKGLAPILIVLLIAAAIGGYFYFGKINLNKPTPQQTTQPSPTTDVSPVPNGTGETADWKTYINTEEGYTFENPGSWFLTTITLGSGAKAVVISPNLAPGERPSIWISVEENPFNLPPKEWWLGDMKETITLNKIKLIETTLKEQDFHGYSALYVDSPETELRGAPKALYISKDKKIYSIVANGFGIEEVYKGFDKILSTFKFTQ